MKKLMYKCFLFLTAVLVSTTIMAQSETNPAGAFKDLRLRETHPHFEHELKKKELQKAPSLLYIDKTDRITKKTKRRKPRLS